MDLQEVLTHFDVKEVKGHNHMCLCPCHADNAASLSISEGRNGRILIHCFAGCGTGEILEAVGLCSNDICGGDFKQKEHNFLSKMDYGVKQKLTKDGKDGASYKRTAIYDYRDADGSYLYSKVRYEGNGDKEMRFKRIDYANETWENGKGETDAVLYHFPELLKAVEAGEQVFYCEGEKDVLTLQKLGFVACTAGGVKNWKPHFAEFFKGANVALLPDNDDPGKELMNKVRFDLLPVVQSLRIVETSKQPKGDITDWINEGHTAEELKDLCSSAPDLKEEPEAVVDLWQFHKVNQFGRATDTFDDLICEEIAEKNCFLIANGQLYRYHKGFFQRDIDGVWAKAKIKALIFTELRTSQRINRIHSLLLMRAGSQTTLEDMQRHPDSMVCFQDCTYDLMTGEVHQHSPDFRFLNQIPFRFKQIEEPPADSITLRFLNSLITSEDDREMLLEFCGLCLTNSIEFQKFLILKGSGGLGKSLLLRLLCNALGKENVSSFPIQSLTGKESRFNTAYLVGRLANICADISSRSMDEVDGIKRLTGGDQIAGEYKGGASFFFTPCAKLVFSANRIPHIKDDGSNAFYRRLLVLHITHRAEEIEGVEKKLADDIASFYWLILQAAGRLFQRGHFTESQESRDQVEELYAASDPVRGFLRERCELGATKKIRRVDLYEAFTKWMEENKATYTITARGFYDSLRDKELRESRVNGEYFFWGVDLQNEGFTEPEPQEEIPFT